MESSGFIKEQEYVLDDEGSAGQSTDFLSSTPKTEHLKNLIATFK